MLKNDIEKEKPILLKVWQKDKLSKELLSFENSTFEFIKKNHICNNYIIAPYGKS